MKFNLKHLLLTFSTLMFNLSANAWQEYHGGDLERVQLHSLASQIFLEARQIPTAELDTNRLYKSFYSQNTNIIFTADQLIIDQNKKIAIVKKEKANKACEDYNTCEITINFPSWTGLNKAEKEILLIHEMYNLTSTPDINYELSSVLYEKILILRSLNSDLKTTVTTSMNNCDVQQIIDLSPLILSKKYIQQLSTLVSIKPAAYCESVNNLIEKLFQHFEVNEED